MKGLRMIVLWRLFFLVYTLPVKSVGVWWEDQQFVFVSGAKQIFSHCSITAVLPGYIMLLFLSLLFWNVFH